MLKKFLQGKTTDNKQIDMTRIPQHIAIIMDGNGRWAKRRGLPRSMGHAKGAETLKTIVKAANGLGVKALTVYAFSTENWKRPMKEVVYIMKLLEEYLDKHIAALHKENVRMRVIGDISKLSEILQENIKRAEALTKDNTGLTLQVAINYGGRDEITRAVKEIASEVKDSKLNVEDISMDLISEHLDTLEFSNVDLLIRPSNDFRISNFLLWQLAYAEFWFTDTHWPDFSRETLLEAICAYQKRERRFGGLKGEDN